MKNKGKLFIGFVVIVLMISISCISCGSSTEQITTDEHSIMSSSKGEETVAIETEPLLCLKNGDTQSLVGFTFGDEIDYNRFDIRSYSDENDMYCLKDFKNQEMFFLFNGKGIRFSGLKMSWEGDFFGIKLGEDSLNKVSDVLGPPDEYQQTKEIGIYEAIYYFEKAVLLVRIKDNLIRGFEYTANWGVADGKEIPIDQTELGRDKMADNSVMETVYSWSAIYSSEDPPTDSFYHPYNDNYDENYTDDFIQNYLTNQGIEKEKPDGVSYNQNGDPFVEYYIDEALNKYCFVVHLWAKYWIDYEQGISKYRDAIYCTTYYLDEEDKVGYVLRNFDENSGITRERAYDRFGRKAAEISYEYQKGIPFPFVTDGWNLNTEFEPVSFLCRNQVFWFYKEFSQFDQTGQFMGYHNNTNQLNIKEYLPYQSSCNYDKNGRFTTISEELQQEDIDDNWGWWDESIDYSGQIKVTYSKNDKVKAVNYIRSSNIHGTTNSTGSVEYDEKGRMIYNEYYITHGSHINIYLYDENSEMPWVCFSWCSYAPGFENIYLFRQEP